MGADSNGAGGADEQTSSAEQSGAEQRAEERRPDSPAVYSVVFSATSDR